MTKKHTNPSIDVEFHIRRDSVVNVASGLLSGDISECMVGDVKHTADLLARLVVLQDLAPGFLNEMLALFIPHFIKMRHKEDVGEKAQSFADCSGFGDEWRAAVVAGNHPKQKDYMASMVAVYMKANGVNQANAIRAIAEQMGRDEDGLRRVVTRSKKRS